MYPLERYLRTQSCIVLLILNNLHCGTYPKQTSNGEKQVFIKKLIYKQVNQTVIWKLFLLLQRGTI